MAMLFDFSTMATAEQARAQKSALDFLEHQLKPADLVAIMTAGTGPLKIEQDFTDDKDRLIEVIKKFNIGEASDLAGLSGNGGDSTSGEDTGTAFNADETEFNIFNNDRKLVTLESAAKLLAAFPEKKALIYFSSGLEQTTGSAGLGNDNQAQLESAVNAAKRANVAFYPIDARGLIATAPAGDASSAGGRGTSAFTGRQCLQPRRQPRQFAGNPFDARLRYRRQALCRRQRPHARHGEGPRRHQQLLHPRLLQQ